ncbi:hypothetical protein DM860_016844 [Cuscuta australis]|uniref:Uncharacterized protein n=1 Tax=Cuscuta australis TaxID=267555 RepID=A0A328CUR5_9ASTE|nr:hypothetical protein DM860_016844 [Cuscuta australis]
MVTVYCRTAFPNRQSEISAKIEISLVFLFVHIFDRPDYDTTSTLATGTLEQKRIVVEMNSSVVSEINKAYKGYICAIEERQNFVSGYKFHHVIHLNMFPELSRNIAPLDDMQELDHLSYLNVLTLVFVMLMMGELLEHTLGIHYSLFWYPL